MGWVTGTIVYLLVWWVTLFAVLPWGSHPPAEHEKGHAASAPEKPRLVVKFMVTTLIAAIIWVGIYILIEIEIINFYDLSKQMIDRDNLK